MYERGATAMGAHQEGDRPESCLQFMVRRTMIAVAIIACLLGGSIEFARLRRAAQDYRARAARHATMERQLEHFFNDQGLPELAKDG
jgi:hypothetical protein